MPAGQLVEPPEDMTELEKNIWRKTIENSPHGLLRPLDENMVRMFVEAVATRTLNQQKVREFGSVVKSPRHGMPIKSPYQVVVDQQTEIIKHLTAELGFSPTSRSRITLTAGGSKGANRFANNAAKKRA